MNTVRSTGKRTEMAEDKRVSVVANAIGWELYSEDGREVFQKPDPNKDYSITDTINVSELEIERIYEIAYRVIQDLDEYNRKQPVCESCGQRGHNRIHQDHT